MLNTIVFFSSTTNNTTRFVNKLGFEDTTRIPIHITKENSPVIDRPYCLICPTYGGGATMLNTAQDSRPVPPQVRKFLSIKENKDNLTAVISSGNSNFGKEFCLSGDVISQKFGVPYVYRFELLGTPEDVKNVQEGLKGFTWTDRNGVFHS